MSTRSNVKFIQGKKQFQLYVHWDGYPSSRLPDIGRFLKWNASRNEDISYTTANYVLWTKLDTRNKGETIEDTFERVDETDLHRGIGLVKPCTPAGLKGSWIEYFYIVDLDKKNVKCYDIGESKTALIHTISFKDTFDDLINFTEPEDNNET